MATSCPAGHYIINASVEGRSVALDHLADPGSIVKRMQTAEGVVNHNFAENVSAAGGLINFLAQYLVVGLKSGDLVQSAQKRQLAGELIQLYIWKTLRNTQLFVEGNELVLDFNKVGATYNTEVRLRQLPVFRAGSAGNGAGGSRVSLSA